MTDQRDLAAEVERVATFWGDRPEIKTLLQHIAALSRELEEHREALRWALKQACIESLSDLEFDLKVDPSAAHLRAVLAKAKEGK